MSPEPARGDLPRVCILTADSGGGHRAATRSLTEALTGCARVSDISLLDAHTPFPLNALSAIYGPSVNYVPGLYHLLYQSVASRRRILMLEHAAYPFVRQRIAAAMAAERPDLWISVHPLQVDMPLWALRQSGSRAPFVTVVTDPVTPHVAWFCPDTDLCVVATETARDVALACGVPPERVQVIGLPIRRAFETPRTETKPEARAGLGLEPDLPLVLLSGGGAGIGRLLPIAAAIGARLAHRSVRSQMAVIAGRNRRLQEQVQAQSWPIPLTAVGYVENMADWLSAADLLITKAGPGTLAEAACLGVPVLITDYVPGQENGNIAWVEQHGAGIFEANPDRIATWVDEWLQPGHPALAEMSARARSIARPGAASRIAQAALQLLAQQRA